jgi:hypothetical protein
LPRTPRLKRYKNTFTYKKIGEKCLRQVSWLSGQHHLSAFPHNDLRSGGFITDNSLITVAGAASALRFFLS